MNKERELLEKSLVFIISYVNPNDWVADKEIEMEKMDLIDEINDYLATPEVKK